MPFVVIIPARLASTRLPNKPLADLGGKPMVVRVAERMANAGATRVMVATDHADIAAACRQHRVDVHMTREDHLSGTDRIAEVAAAIGLPADAVVVNVQGDEPLIAPELVAATAALVSSTVPMATAAHVIDHMHELLNPSFVKVVIDKQKRALYFSRAPIPWCRDGYGEVERDMEQHSLCAHLPDAHRPLRHIGLYAYRNDFLQSYPALATSPLEKIEALEQLRVLWHGLPIAVHICSNAPAAGVDTPEDLRRVQAIFAGLAI